MSRRNSPFLLPFLLCACQGGGGGNSNADPAEPAFDPSNLVGPVTNPSFPLVPGTSWVYEGETEDGTETNVVFVSHLPQDVLGVACTQVVDRVFLDGALVEETFDWYAQDPAGNVWYLGEASSEYEDGEKVSEAGSWRAGEDGAVGGIVIKAKSVVGDQYQQEFLAGVAEDQAKVVATDVLVELSNGDSYRTIQTEEWTPLEPAAVHEFKYYAAGVGLVLEETVDGKERIELRERHDDRAPAIVPARFTSVVDHPFLPLLPGLGLVYEGLSEDGPVRLERTVSGTTVILLGVECIEVEDREWVDGELVEVALDWYAQDEDGNVWYFGEAVDNYEGGVLVDHDGSWAAGVDGAMPGLQIPAAPRLGDSFRQEYLEGEAEDLAAVDALDAVVSVPAGDFTDCLRFLEWNPLEPDAPREFKSYAPGIGLVLDRAEDGSEVLELVGSL